MFENITKPLFVEKCGDLLREAKPHLVRARYEDSECGEFVVVTCENGYEYRIDVTANSLAAIAAAIFNAMTHK